MNHAVLSAEERAIVAEELDLLARSRASIAKHTQKAKRETGGGDLRSVEALRALREEAGRASEDDLPSLLLELSVRQRLAARSSDDMALPELDAPYFAHLRVREASGPNGKSSGTKDYLLGQSTLLDTPNGVRIVDWRVAPVARIFYRYREGDDYEESFPGRDAEGVVLARRIVVIERGELVRIACDDVVLTYSPERDAWSRADLGASRLAVGGAGAAVRPGAEVDMTALLDREQLAAVSAPANEPLLVLGSAGSGKTTVAIHRLAKIASGDPAGHPMARASVIVPEEGLARLTRRLLEPLGASSARVSTLDAWAESLAHQVFGERLPKIWRDAPGLVSSLKRHPALYDRMHERFAKLPKQGLGIKKLRARIADAFTDRAFLEGVVATAGGDLPKSAIEETVAHTVEQLRDPIARELRSITDRARKRAVDGRAIDDGTPEEIAGSIDVEDLPILLCLSAWRAPIAMAEVAQLVVDEAEDFSLFELFLLGKQLSSPPSVTLAGDEMQQTSACFAGWSRATEVLGAPEPRTCRLEISYRCPRPVVEIAHAILGSLAGSRSMKSACDGAPVGRFVFPQEAHALLFLVTALRELVDREPHASIAVLTRDEASARHVFEIAREVPSSRLALGGAFSFEPGIDIADVDSAKGLEFDYVIVPDATRAAYPATDDARRRLHVAVTRASHQLWIVAGGPPSPCLAALPDAPVSAASP